MLEELLHYLLNTSGNPPDADELVKVPSTAY